MSTGAAFALSPQQRRLLLLRGNAVVDARTRIAVTVAGRLERSATRATLLTLMRENADMRRRYHVNGEGLAVTLLSEDGIERSLFEIPLDGATDAEHVLRRFFDGELDRRPSGSEPAAIAYAVLDAPDSDTLLLLSAPCLSGDPVALHNVACEVGRGDNSDSGGRPLLPYDQYCGFVASLERSEAAQPGKAHWAAHASSVQARGGSARTRCEAGIRGENRELPDDIVRALEAWSEENGISLEPCLLACWTMVLHRSQIDAQKTIGVFSTGRAQPSLRNGFGLYARYLPLNGPWRHDATLAEVASRLDRDLDEAREWQECLLDDHLMTAEGPLRFHFGFSYTACAQGALVRDKRFQLLDQDCDLEQCCIELSIFRSLEGIRFRLKADASYVRLPDLDGWSEAFLSAVEQLSMAPRVSPWRARSKAALAPGLERINHGFRSFPSSFEQRAMQYPDRVAVVADEGHVTYAELERRSRRLAHLLRASGVREEVPVAILLERSAAAMIAVLAVLRAGGACLPLEPRDPPARWHELMTSSGVTLLLSRASLCERLAAGPWTVVCVESSHIASAIDDGDEPLVSGTAPHALAYVMHTSGTTGRPVACMVEHRSVANLVEALDETIYDRARACRRVGVNGTLAFDTSVKQWLQLHAGATLIMIPESVRYGAETLYSFLQEREVETLDITPSHLQLLLQRPGDELLPKSLTCVLVGGEAIDPAAWDRLASASAPVCFNLYGVTECTVDSAIGEIAHGTEPRLGPPIKNTSLAVCDQYYEALPCGMAGELWVGGAGVGRGYLFQPELTAEKFRPDPGGAEWGARMYRTGDLARARVDGGFDYLGRREQTIKLRGYRISPDELQLALRAHPQVQAAAVLVRAGDTPRLEAFVIPRRRAARSVDGRARYLLPNGLAVLHLNKNETDFLYTEIFQREAYFRHGISLQPGDTVFDVGANIGLFSLRCFLEEPSVEVFAFEPNPAAFAVLSANAELYDLSVRLFPTALGQCEGRREFFQYPEFSILSGFHADAADDGATVLAYVRNQAATQPRTLDIGAETALLELLEQRLQARSLTAPVQTLTAVMARFDVQRISLLKVNVEKGEEDVLCGIDAAAWRRIDNVAMEVHDIDGRLQRVTTLLETNGFDVATERDWSLGTHASTNYYIYARRPAATAGKSKGAVGPMAAPVLPSPFLSPAEVRDFVGSLLPEYMQPHRVFVVDSIPLTSRGKVDTGALERLADSEEAPLQMPQSELETAIAEVWKGVLRTDTVPRDRTFFDLGGNSFSLVEVRHALRRDLELEVKLTDLFRHPTIASLATFLLAFKQETSSPDAEQRAAQRLRALRQSVRKKGVSDG